MTPLSIPTPAIDPSSGPHKDDPSGISEPALVPQVVPALGDRAARGAAWSLIQIIGSKVVSIIGLLVLSWLLGSTEYGYVSLVYGVAAFVNLIQQAGIRDVLVQRSHEFDKWSAPAFWLSLLMGILSTVVMIIAAPLAAWFFNDPRVEKLIYIVAPQNILASLCVLPEVKMWIDLRFKLTSALFFFFAVAMTALNIILAAPPFRLGALAFIIPWPAVALLRLIFVWMMSPVRIGRPSLHLWPLMIGDNLKVFVASFFFTITWQADYFILGRMYPKPEVGRYFWAFNLSAQSIQLVSLNASGVLFPSLAKLSLDPPRQFNAFLRAARVLMIVATPACLLQATLADPLIRLVFKAEWHAAIPIVQILSVGWLLASLSLPAASLIKTQGRFTTFLNYTAFSAVLFIGLVYLGARARAGLGAAAGVALFSAVTGPLIVHLSIRTIGGRWRDVWRIYAAPTLCGVISFGVGLALAQLIPASMPPRLYHLARAAIAFVVGMGLYLPLIRLTAPDGWRELRDRVGNILGPLLRRRAAAAAL